MIMPVEDYCVVLRFNVDVLSQSWRCSRYNRQQDDDRNKEHGYPAHQEVSLRVTPRMSQATSSWMMASSTL